MALADWLDISQIDGEGDASVSVGSKGYHTGRLNRQTVIKWVAADVAPIERTVIQQGRGPMSTFKSPSRSVTYKGGQIRLTGVSNERYLTFTFGEGDLLLDMPRTYIAAGVERPTRIVQGMDSDAGIPGDPGASSAYDFSIIFDVPENVGERQTRQIIAHNPDKTYSAICTIISTPNEAYVEIPEGDIILDHLGTPVTIEVKSNTKWDIV